MDCLKNITVVTLQTGDTDDDDDDNDVDDDNNNKQKYIHVYHQKKKKKRSFATMSRCVSFQLLIYTKPFNTNATNK
jgi:hypothetical protein